MEGKKITQQIHQNHRYRIIHRIRDSRVGQTDLSNHPRLKVSLTLEAAPTWQWGDERVDVLNVPLARVTGQEAVGQQGQFRVLHCRYPLVGQQGGQGSFVARQVWALAGLSLRREHRVTSGQSSSSRLLHRGCSLSEGVRGGSETESIWL